MKDVRVYENEFGDVANFIIDVEMFEGEDRIPVLVLYQNWNSAEGGSSDPTEITRIDATAVTDVRNALRDALEEAMGPEALFSLEYGL